MNEKNIVLLFVCLLIAFYLKLDWLVFFLVLVLVLIAIASIGRKEEKVPVPKGEREVIYPVIYEDVGEPPYLYSPKTTIKIREKAREHKYGFERIAYSAGTVVHAGLRGVKKLFGE